MPTLDVCFAPGQNADHNSPSLSIQKKEKKRTENISRTHCAVIVSDEVFNVDASSDLSLRIHSVQDVRSRISRLNKRKQYIEMNGVYSNFLNNYVTILQYL